MKHHKPSLCHHQSHKLHNDSLSDHDTFSLNNVTTLLIGSVHVPLALIIVCTGCLKRHAPSLLVLYI